MESNESHIGETGLIKIHEEEVREINLQCKHAQGWAPFPQEGKIQFESASRDPTHVFVEGRNETFLITKADQCLQCITVWFLNWYHRYEYECGTWYIQILRYPAPCGIRRLKSSGVHQNPQSLMVITNLFNSTLQKTIPESCWLRWISILSFQYQIRDHNFEYSTWFEPLIEKARPISWGACHWCPRNS